MSFFTTPSAFRLAQLHTPDFVSSSSGGASFSQSAMAMLSKASPHSSHPPLGHLVLLVFEAVLEVVCVSAPGYIIARQGMFDVEMQKFVANLNVSLFTPCLIFTKLASQLTAGKLADLAVIPVIFALQTIVSYLCSIGVARLLRFPKRPRNFLIAMGVFGNSNSLPISLVIALSQTLKGLHWDKIPGDNDDEVAARGILYLLIFQQLGQVVRWSWGYNVLLAPPETFEEEQAHSDSRVEQGRGRYRDDAEADADSEQDLLGASDSEDENHSSDLSGTRVNSSQDMTDSSAGQQIGAKKGRGDSSRSEDVFGSGDLTPVTQEPYTSSISSRKSYSKGPVEPASGPGVSATPVNGNVLDSDALNEHITSFPSIGSPSPLGDGTAPAGPRGWIILARIHVRQGSRRACLSVSNAATKAFAALPPGVQRALATVKRVLGRFLYGLWEFMNPPLWAMLAAIVVASIPSLQRLFFTEGTFLQNSVTRAVSQSGGVAVPLILVVLGANLARNTGPADAHVSVEHEKLEKKLLVASIVCRMLLPTIIMAPILALAAKYVPVSILDDPIFVIVCFLLTGAPSALQLAQICQLNGVYEGVMAKLLFQSYVIWSVHPANRSTQPLTSSRILPSTLLLVMSALEVVEWANNT
ncbi:MAG: hypothetical protein M1832_005045 [Thelocarpon impressellum]|nr:MAG: hypothetical protein M1832_005045 [Thelocarpon impressellum]